MHAQPSHEIGQIFWANSDFSTVVCGTEKFTDIVIILNELNASVVLIKTPADNHRDLGWHPAWFRSPTFFLLLLRSALILETDRLRMLTHASCTI